MALAGAGVLSLPLDHVVWVPPPAVLTLDDDKVTPADAGASAADVSLVAA